MRSSLEIDDLLESYLKDGLKTLNSQLPRRRKRLSVLLKEEEPHVILSDGTPHFFRRKELLTLSRLLKREDRERIMLPIIIEVTGGKAEMVVSSPEGIENKIFPIILGMPVQIREGRIILYKPQVSALRSQLRTATQYVFLA